MFDTALISRFEWLRAQPKDETATPALYMVFDCLYARGKDLRERPLRIRRHVLEGEVDGHRLILPVRRLADDGLKAWEQVVERAYEGLVAKDPASPYVGGRTMRWLKVKQPRGTLRAQVAQTLPLNQTAEAHRLLEEQKIVGAVTLNPKA